MTFHALSVIALALGFVMLVVAIVTAVTLFQLRRRVNSDSSEQR